MSEPKTTVSSVTLEGRKARHALAEAIYAPLRGITDEAFQRVDKHFSPTSLGYIDPGHPVYYEQIPDEAHQQAYGTWFDAYHDMRPLPRRLNDLFKSDAPIDAALDNVERGLRMFVGKVARVLPPEDAPFVEALKVAARESLKVIETAKNAQDQSIYL